MPDTSSKTSFTPQSHFFAGTPAFSQSESQAFGPVDANRFNLTAGFNISSEGIKAFAICSGIVLIQPQNESEDKVNLILRPYKQPAPGLNIKYFIYRGLKMSDFFNVGKVVPSSAASSDFINKINASFASFHTSISPDEALPDFLAKYIGFDPANQPDDLLLDYFFFKESEYVQSSGEFVEKEDTAFELPIIGAGKSLGTFAPGECGIDVVLSYGDYKLPQPNDEFVFNLNYARKNFARLDLAAEPDLFKKKLIKEQCTQFLDIAAWYGFHYKEGGYVTLDNAGTKEKKTGEQIYTDLLQSFYSRNRLYVYIQSDRTRSYNFYGNYVLEEGSSFSLKVGVTETGLVAKDFGTMGWPLLIDEEPQAHNVTCSKLHLQLVTDNNENAMLYGQVAQIDNAQKDNFVDTENLQQPADVNGIRPRFTKNMILSNPAVGPEGAKTYAASFNILIYQGINYSYKTGTALNEQLQIVDVLTSPNFFDDVFGEINAIPLFKAGVNTEYSRVTSHKLRLINHSADRGQLGISAMHTITVNDVIDTGIQSSPALKRVTYITEAAKVLNNAISVTGKITADTKTSPSGSESVTGIKSYKLPDPFYYTLKLFTENTENINGLELKSLDESIPNKIILGLTNAENDVLKALITVNSLTNARLFLVDLFEDGNPLLSAENILYQKYKAGIVGEKTDGKLELFLPAEDVIVYSLDRKWHFSKEYSEFVKEDLFLSLTLDLDISL